MIKQIFHIKRRANRSAPYWDSVCTADTESTAFGICRNLVDNAQGPDKVTLEHAVFTGGRIILWFRGGKDITKNSRQVTPPPSDHSESEEPSHRTFEFWHQGEKIAECVARDPDTAWRMLCNDLPHWDDTMINQQEADNDHGPNRWVMINPKGAPMKERA